MTDLLLNSFILYISAHGLYIIIIQIIGFFISHKCKLLPTNKQCMRNNSILDSLNYLHFWLYIKTFLSVNRFISSEKGEWKTYLKN